jgi:hypothetical protein
LAREQQPQESIFQRRVSTGNRQRRERNEK